ncbi:MAG: Exodeoxyribonuclease [Acidimicrobiales bacterium]|nr:Exodeoxyribonuclease [Acidimicrobiales bacterium]
MRAWPVGPVARPTAGRGAAARVAGVRIATWNVNSLNARLGRVEEWLAYADADIVCLQETKLADEAFPGLTFQALGYDTAHVGQGRWNGVAILSRVGLSDVASGFGDGGDPDSEARLVWATCGGIRVASAYVPNGREVGHDHYRYKLAWLARLRAHLEASLDPSDDIAVCGDFNIAPTDQDVWDPSAFVGATHVSEEERAALASLTEWGLVDAFRERQPEPKLFSWWDYRAGMFHKHQGMRIDLVLASRSVADRTTFATIDRNARKGKLPSDHAPVIVDIADA